MYTKTYRLEPITPMVHFQGTEKDATIRGNELKPMLDQFLTRYLEKKGKLAEYESMELATEGDDAEDYKHYDYQVKIAPYKTNVVHKSQMKKNKSDVKELDSKDFFLKNITVNYELVLTYPDVVFKTRHIKLLRVIQEVFPMFIAISYFGRRKGKGYGQFWLKDNIENQEQLIKNAFSCLGETIKFVPFTISKTNTTQSLNAISDKNLQLKKTIAKKSFKISLPILNNNLKNEKVKMRDNYASGEFRFSKLMLGLANELGDYSIKGKKIERLENPLQYYLNSDPQKNTAFLVIRIDKIKQILETGPHNFEFEPTKSKKFKSFTIQSPRLNEVNIDNVVEILAKEVITKASNQNGGRYKGQSRNRNQNFQNRNWKGNQGKPRYSSNRNK